MARPKGGTVLPDPGLVGRYQRSASTQIGIGDASWRELANLALGGKRVCDGWIKGLSCLKKNGRATIRAFGGKKRIRQATCCARP